MATESVQNKAVSNGIPPPDLNLPVRRSDLEIRIME